MIADFIDIFQFSGKKNHQTKLVSVEDCTD